MAEKHSAQPTRRELRQQRDGQHPETEQASPGKTDAAPRPRRRATISSVLGELMLTAGVVVLLFVVWQMWVGDQIMGAEANREGAALTEQWDALPPPPIPEPIVGDDDEVWYEPVIGNRPVGTEDFATLLVPRFGDDYTVPIAGGTTRKYTLDRKRLGLYADSAMPGEVGNFAIAGHRTTWGAALGPIDTLQLGDSIIIAMPEGWYRYEFRNLQYVTPTQVDVLLDVPQIPGLETGERYITLTACSPKHSLAERIVAYGVFDQFQPRALGEPDWLHESLGGDS